VVQSALGNKTVPACDYRWNWVPGWCLWSLFEPQASKYEFYLCYVVPCVLLKKAAVLVMKCPRVAATKLGKNRSESTLIP
jgi:hypothetical protein